MLLKYGVNLEPSDHNSCTPLLYAVLCGNVVAVKFLLSKRASIFAKDNHGYSVFSYCGRSVQVTDNTIEMIDLLLSYLMEKYPNNYEVEKYKLQEDIICSLHTTWHNDQRGDWVHYSYYKDQGPRIFLADDDAIVNNRAQKAIMHVFDKYGLRILTS